MGNKKGNNKKRRRAQARRGTVNNKGTDFDFRFALV